MRPRLAQRLHKPTGLLHVTLWAAIVRRARQVRDHLDPRNRLGQNLAGLQITAYEAWLGTARESQDSDVRPVAEPIRKLPARARRFLP